MTLPFLEFAKSATSTIPFNVLIGGSESLKIHTNPADAESIMNHGCWCSKFGYSNSHALGGAPIDDIDQLCKQWIQDRKCCRMFGGPCYNDLPFNEVTYQVEHLDPVTDQGDVNKTSCYDLNTNACTNEACVTDNYYAKEISDLVNLYNTDGWNPVSPGADTEVKRMFLRKIIFKDFKMN